MKVLHLITGLHTGGAESMLASLVLHPGCRNENLSVVSLVRGGDVHERLVAAGADVRDLGMTRGRPGISPILRLASIIRQERPDVLQSWMYHADLVGTIALALSGRRSATRHFWGVRCSNMDFSRYSLQSRLVFRSCAHLASRPDAVVFNSVAGRDHHLASGFHPRQARVVRNGIDTAHFSPDVDVRRRVRAALGIDEARLVLAHVARVDPMKDHESFLSAVEAFPELEVLLVGEGTEQLPKRVGLHRLGRRRDVADLLRAADIIVSSSRFGEGFSNTIAEGMACGLPAVATAVGDAVEIVGDAGRVVAPGQPEALSRAIEELTEGGVDALRALGARARARIDARFSVEKALREFESLHRGETSC